MKAIIWKDGRRAVLLVSGVTPDGMLLDGSRELAPDEVFDGKELRSIR